MIYEDFQYGFSRLVGAFSPTKPEEKGKVYYDELQSINREAWYAIVDRCVNQEQKFPTIATIRDIYRAIVGISQKEKSECDKCDGYGWAVIDNEAMRGRCEHGDALSKKIARTPGGYVAKKFKNNLTDEDILNYIVPDPIAYAVGLRDSGKFMKKHKPEMYKKSRTLAAEMLGKEKMDELAKKFAKEDREEMKHVRIY